jgi:transcriptional regulator with XRE-family HTH domain
MRGETQLADALGTLLRELRKQAGFTQDKPAEESELGVRTIRRLESGKAGDHRPATVNRLADALKATPGAKTVTPPRRRYGLLS